MSRFGVESAMPSERRLVEALACLFLGLGLRGTPMISRVCSDSIVSGLNLRLRLGVAGADDAICCISGCRSALLFQQMNRLRGLLSWDLTNGAGSRVRPTLWSMQAIEGSSGCFLYRMDSFYGGRTANGLARITKCLYLGFDSRYHV